MNTDELMAAIKAMGDASHTALDSHKKGIEQLFDRVEELETRAKTPGKIASDGSRDSWTKDQREHKDVFCEWLRKPNDGHTKRRLDDAQAEIQSKSAKEGKAVTVGSGPAGGYAVPEILDSQIEARVNLLNPFRSLVRVVQVGSRDWKALVSSNDAGSGWVGEGDARSETGTSRLFERSPTFGTIYAYPKASEESMQDIFFDVGAWLVEEAGDGFAAAEASAIVSGNGTKKPTGFLNSAPVSTVDNASPERDPGTLQYVGASGSPAAISADDLIDLSLSIKERYTLDGGAVAWTMRRTTAAYVRKLKDPSTGLYLWQPSLQAGQPDMLLGYPVRLTDAMPAIAADAIPIAFGNWRRGYLLADRVGTMQITVDDNITTPGQVKFYLRRVVGGCVYNSQALKVLKVTD